MSTALPSPSLGAVAFTEAPAALCVSRRGRVAECNEQFLRLLGYSAEAVIGMSLSRLCGARAGSGFRPRDLVRPLVENGRTRSRVPVRCADGRELVCEVAARSTGQSGLVVWLVEEVQRPRPERDLSPREREVADLLLQGQTAKQMARRLGLSPRTVEMHRANLMKKFAASTTPALVAVLSGGAMRRAAG